VKITLLLLLSLLVACVSQPSADVESDGERQRQLEVQRQQQRVEQLRYLLSKAQRALEVDRLMTPVQDNAVGWYRQVLSMDARNKEAQWGLRQVAERYLQLAGQALAANERSRAEVFFERALTVAATEKQVAAVRARYRGEAAVNELRLPEEALAARSQRVIAMLATWAEKARLAEARLTIIARNDAEGRWIYQQMRQAVTGYRLRGNIEIGRRPAVILNDG
jgi:hypothetical protein